MMLKINRRIVLFLLSFISVSLHADFLDVVGPKTELYDKIISIPEWEHRYEANLVYVNLESVNDEKIVSLKTELTSGKVLVLDGSQLYDKQHREDLILKITGLGFDTRIMVVGLVNERLTYRAVEVDISDDDGNQIGDLNNINYESYFKLSLADAVVKTISKFHDKEEVK